MFSPELLRNLAETYHSVFHSLHKMQRLLSQRFTGMDDAVLALLLAVAGGEPMLLIGPPGTAKSRLIRAFCGLIGVVDENEPARPHDRYFEYLLTPFTEPAELFGFYDIPKVINERRMERLDAGMMQNAEVVYLDEIFNGSSAILNSILTFLNERVFHDHGQRRKVKMQCLFAATNRVPDTPELRAVLDRFVLRCRVENVAVDPKAVGDLLRKGWRETYGTHQLGRFAGLLDELKAFRHAIRAITDQGSLFLDLDHPFYLRLTQMIQHARQYELSTMSNRRLVKMVYLMLIHRVYEGVVSGQLHDAMRLGPSQLRLIPRFFLDRYDEELVWNMEAAAG